MKLLNSKLLGVPVRTEEADKVSIWLEVGVKCKHLNISDNSGSWIQDPVSWIQDPGARILDPGGRKVRTANYVFQSPQVLPAK